MKAVAELWAVLDKNGNVKWSRGGSSTKAHLMVYPSEEKAEQALSNYWTKQVIDRADVRVEQVYVA